MGGCGKWHASATSVGLMPVCRKLSCRGSGGLSLDAAGYNVNACANYDRASKTWSKCGLEAATLYCQKMVGLRTPQICRRVFAGHA